MDKTWLLEVAEGHLAELVQRAVGGEVQIITREGERAAVFIDYAHYLSLSKPKSLLAVLRGEPPYTDDLKLERDKSPGRAVELE